MLAYNNIRIPLQRIAQGIEHEEIELKTVIFNFLENPTVYVTVKSTGRPNILPKRSEILIMGTLATKIFYI